MTPEEKLLGAEASRFDIELTPEATARLTRFLDLLEIWNRRVRLTGERDRATIVGRHVVDCLAPVPYLPESGLVVDIGSGAGFPGIILACVRPDIPLVLIEARRRRASFLAEAIGVLALSRVRVLERRAEDATADRELGAGAHCVIARAVRLDVFLGLARPLLAPGGFALAMQTPRIGAVAGATATRLGFRILSSHEYTLPGGAPRSLLLLGRLRAPAPPVSSPGALC